MNNENNTSGSGSNKKKKILASAIAVALAAVLLIGGTFSYLTATSTTVVNEFNTNDIEVDVDETTGNEYEIIPGTTQKKNPYVTVTTSVDAYVYLFVTDNTDDMVEWAIANGWTLLYDASTSDSDNPFAGTNTTVYYREVEVDETGTAQEFSFKVLKGNRVTYSEELTNEDMYDEDGNLKNNLTLSFYAIAIQSDGFESASEAFSSACTTVSTAEELSTAAASGGTIILTADITTTTSVSVDEGESLILYLDGYTLTNSSTDTVTVAEGGYAEISGGTIDATAHAKAAVKNNGGTMVISNTTLSRSAEAGTSSTDNGGNSYYVIANYGTMTLEDCVVEADGSYSSLIINEGLYDDNDNLIATSSLTINGGTYSTGLNTIKNSSDAVLVINDGTFIGDQHALLNFGTATINGGTFISNSGCCLYNWYYGEHCPAVLTVTGGTFTAPSTSYLTLSVYNSDYNKTNITFSGGTFSSQYLIYPTNVDSDSSWYLASGYTLESNSDGTYSVVASSTSSDE